MNKKSKSGSRTIGLKVLSLVLALVLVIGMVPALALGGSEEHQADQGVQQEQQQSPEQQEGTDTVPEEEGDDSSGSPSQNLSVQSTGAVISGDLNIQSDPATLSIGVDPFTTPTTQPAGFDNSLRLSTSVSNASGGYVMIVPILSTGQDDTTSTRVANLFDTYTEYVGKNYDNTDRGFGGYGTAFTIPGTSTTLDNALLIWVPTTNGAGSFNDYRILYTFPNGTTKDGSSIAVTAYIAEATGVTNNAVGQFAGGTPVSSTGSVSFTATAAETWSTDKEAQTTTMSNFAEVDYVTAQNESIPAYKVSYSVAVNSSRFTGDLGRQMMSGLTINDTVSWQGPAGAKPTSIVIKDGSTTIKTIAASDIISSPYSFSWSSNDVTNWLGANGYFTNKTFTVEVTFDANEFVQWRDGSGMSTLATVNNTASVTYTPVNDYTGATVTGGTSAEDAATPVSFGWKQKDPTLPSLTIEKWLKISGVERAYTAALGNSYEPGAGYANGGNSNVVFSLTPVTSATDLTPTGAAVTKSPVFSSNGTATAMVDFGQLEPGAYVLKETTGITNFHNTTSQAALAGTGLIVVVSPPDAQGVSTLTVNGDDYTANTRNLKVVNETTSVGSIKIRTKQQQLYAYPTAYTGYNTLTATLNNRLQLDTSISGIGVIGGTDENIYNYIIIENVPVGNYTLKDLATAENNQNLLFKGLVSGLISNSIGEDYTSTNIAGNAVEVSGTAQNAYTAYFDSSLGGFRAYKKFYDTAGNEVTNLTGFTATYQLYTNPGLTTRPSWASTDEEAQFVVKYNSSRTPAVVEKEFPEGVYYLKEVALTTTPAAAAATYGLDTSGTVMVTITAGSYSAIPVPALGGTENLRVDASGNLKNLSLYGELAIKNFNNDGSLKGNAYQQFIIQDSNNLYWRIAADGTATSSSSVTYNTVSNGILRGFVPAGTYTVTPAYAPNPSNGVPSGQVLADSSTTVVVVESTEASPGTTAETGVTYNKNTGFANITYSQTAAFAWQNLPVATGVKYRYTNGIGGTANTWPANVAKFTLWKLNDNGTPALATDDFYEKTTTVVNVGANGSFTTPQLAVGKYLLIETSLPSANYQWPAYTTAFASTPVAQDVAEDALTNSGNGNLIFEIESSDLEDTAPGTVTLWNAYNTPLNTFTIIKTDANGGARLSGAEFSLYSDASCQNQIGSTVTTAVSTGSVNITGLAPGTYYLKETKAPAGYSPDPTVIKIEIDANGWPSVSDGYGGVTTPSNGSTQNITAITVSNIKRAEIAFVKTGETDEFDANGVDRQRQTMAGIEFTLLDSDGFYWQVNATTGLATITAITNSSEAPKITTDADGAFNINGLDPTKTYTLAEVSTPTAPSGQAYITTTLELSFKAVYQTPDDNTTPIVGYEVEYNTLDGEANSIKDQDGNLVAIEIVNTIESYKVHLAKLPVKEGDAVGEMQVDRYPTDPTGDDWAANISAIGAKFVLYRWTLTAENPTGEWVAVDWLETGTGDNWPSNDAWSRDLPVGEYKLVETKKPLLYSNPGDTSGYIYEGTGNYYDDFPSGSTSDWKLVSGNGEGILSYTFEITANSSEVTTIIAGNTGRPGSGGGGSMLLTRFISLYGQKDGYSLTANGTYEYEGPLANVDFEIYPAYKDASGRYVILPTVGDEPLSTFTSASHEVSSLLETGQFITGWLDIIQTYQYGGDDWNTNSAAFANYDINKTYIENTGTATHFPEYRAGNAGRDGVKVDWTRASEAARYLAANEIMEWDLVIVEAGNLPANYAANNTDAEFGFTVKRAVSSAGYEVQYYANGNSVDGLTSGTEPEPYALNNYRGEGYVSLVKNESGKTDSLPGATVELWSLDPSVVDLLPANGDLASLSSADYDALIAGANYYTTIPSGNTNVKVLPGYYIAREITAPAGLNTFGTYTTLTRSGASGSFTNVAFGEGAFFGPIAIYDADGQTSNRTLITLKDYAQPDLKIANYWNGVLQTATGYSATYTIDSTDGYSITQLTSTGNGTTTGMLNDLRDGNYAITLSAKSEPSGADDYKPNNALDENNGNKELTFTVTNGVIVESSVKLDGVALTTAWNTSGLRLVKTGAVVTGIDINHAARGAVIIIKGGVNADGSKTSVGSVPAGLTSATFGVEKLISANNWQAQADVTWNAATDAAGLRVTLQAGTYRFTEKSVTQNGTPADYWTIDSTPVYVVVGEEGIVYLQNATSTAGSTEANALETTTGALTAKAFYNNAAYGKVKISKVASPSAGFNTSVIAGATFEVYKDANKDGEPDDTTVWATVTYSSTSPAGYYATLPAGDYVVKETVAPNGYALRAGYEKLTVTAATAASATVNWVKFVDPVPTTFKVAKVTEYGAVGSAGDPGYIEAHLVKVGGVQLYLWKRIPGTTGLDAINFELVGSAVTARDTSSAGIGIGEALFTITEEGEYRVTEALISTQTFVTLNAAYATTGFTYTGSESPADAGGRGLPSITLGTTAQEPVKYVYNATTGALEISTTNEDWNQQKSAPNADVSNMLAVNNAFNGYVVVAQKLDATTGKLVTGAAGASFALYATEADALADTNRLDTKVDADGVGYVFFDPSFIGVDTTEKDLWVRELTAPAGYTLDPWYEVPIKKVTAEKANDTTGVSPAIAGFSDGPLATPALSLDKDVAAGEQGYLTTEPTGTVGRVDVANPLAASGFDTAYTVEPAADQENLAPLYNYTVSDNGFAFWGGTNNATQITGPTYELTQVAVGPTTAYSSYHDQRADTNTTTGEPSGASRVPVYARVNGGEWKLLSATADTLFDLNGNTQTLTVEYTMDTSAAAVPYVGTWLSAGAIEVQVSFDAYIPTTSQPEVTKIVNTAAVNAQTRSYSNTDLAAPTFSYTSLTQATDDAVILIENPNRPVMTMQKEAYAPSASELTSNPLFPGDEGRLKYRITMLNSSTEDVDITNPVIIDYLDEALTLNTVESITLTQNGVDTDLTTSGNVVHTAITPQVQRWTFEGYTLEPGDSIVIEISTNIAQVVSDGGNLVNEAYGTSTTWLGNLRTSSKYPAGASFVADNMSAPYAVWSGNTNGTAAAYWNKLSHVAGLNAADYGLFVRAADTSMTVNSGGKVYVMKSVKVGNEGYTSSSDTVKVALDSSSTVTYRLSLQNSQALIPSSQANSLANLRIVDVIPYPADSRATEWDTALRSAWQLDTTSFIVNINGVPVDPSRYTVLAVDSAMDAASEATQIAAFRDATSTIVGNTNQLASDSTAFMVVFGNPVTAGSSGDPFVDDNELLLAPDDLIEVEYTMTWDPTVLADATAVAGLYTNNNLEVATNNYLAYYNPLIEKSGGGVLITNNKTETSNEVNVELAAPRVTISGMAFEDYNYNGLQDFGEPTLAGVPVYLYKKVGSGSAEAVVADADGIAYTNFETAANGSYSFTNLESSYQSDITYEVRFGTPASGTGWIRTAQNQGLDTLDSDAADDAATNPGYTGFFAAETNDAGVANAASIANVDAGYYRLSSISGWAWDDLDADGLQDANETQGRQSVNVYLYSSEANAQAGSTTVGTGGLIAKTVTDADGAYSFSGLQSGNYYLRFDKSAAETATKFYKWTLQTVGSDTTVDSDPTPYDGSAYITSTPDYTTPTGDYAANAAITQNAAVVTYNATTQNVDAGLVPISKTVRVYVWEDKNYDGIVDAGEPALSGVAVTLEQSTNGGASWTSYATAATSGTGYVEFNGPNNNDAGIEFGNGITYRVKVEAKGAGYNYSPKTAATPVAASNDSDVNTTGANAGYTDAFAEPTNNLGSGQYQLGSIEGKVWFDSNATAALNADGIQNDPDSKPNPVVITLLMEDPQNAGSYVRASTLMSGYSDQVTTSSSDATYSFGGLKSGNYKVQFELAGVTSTTETYSWTSPNQGGNDTLDSDAVALQGASQTAQTQTIALSYYTDDLAASNYSNGKLNNVDGGIVKTINTISGTVWLDANYDGIQNDADALAGVTVELYKKTNSAASYTQVDSTTTDAQGEYVFNNSEAGIDFADGALYYVKVIKPANSYEFTERDVNNNQSDTIDSDVYASPATNQGESGFISSQTPNAIIDAGLYQTVSVSGMVWYDADADGIRNNVVEGTLLGASNAVAGVTVTLTGTDDSGDAVNRTVTTNAIGTYNFGGLKSGTYTVTVDNGTLDATRGYKWTTTDVGANDALDSDAAGTADAYSTTATVTVVVGKTTSVANVDAGIIPFVNVGGFAWNDTNNNGERDGSETFRNDVLVTLYSDEGGSYAPVSSHAPVTTDTSGEYAFNEILINAGVNHKVAFTNPSAQTLRWSLSNGTSTTGAGTHHTAVDLQGRLAANIFSYSEAHTRTAHLGGHLEGVWNAGLQTIPSYTVTYNPNGGTANGTTSTFTNTVQAGSLVPYYNATRTNYSFNGWFENGGAWDFANRAMPERNVTLVAQWTMDPTYNVYYDANGGAGAPATQSGYFNGDVVVVNSSALPTRAGYTFGGWATTPTGTTAVGTVTINNNHVWLYAIWTALPTYTVTYNANGGTGTQVDGTAYYSGDTVTLLGQGSVTRQGYTFEGWSLTRTGAVIDSFTITANTTVYAIWDTTSTPGVTPPVTPPPTETTPTPFEDILTNVFGEDVPTVSILGNDVPLAAIGYDAWALFNLILAVASVILAVVLLALYFVRRRKNEDEDEAEERRARIAEAEARGEEYEEEGESKKKRLASRIVSGVLAVAAVIFFIVTQDMSLPMVLIDQWTLVHVIVVVAQIVCCVLARKKVVKAEDSEEEMDAARQTLG